MSRKILVFHSTFPPDVVMETLCRNIDAEQWNLFSFTGFKGNNAILGKIESDSFWLRKRRSFFSRNDFAPHFYARLTPEAGGTRIEGYFGLRKSMTLFTRVWVIIAVLTGTPIFILSLLDYLHLGHYVQGDNLVGIIVPPASIAWGFILPAIGRLIGRGDERFIREFIQNTLVARAEEPAEINS